MLPEDVPQAAVDAFWGADRPFPDCIPVAIHRPLDELLAAAAPHLIDDAMIERAAEAIATDHEFAMLAQRGYVRTIVLRILRAALGEVDGDGS